MDRRHTADGRRQWEVWGEPEAREALSELADSGEIAEFACRRGVSARRIYYWKKRIAQTAAPRSWQSPCAYLDMVLQE
jgi:hypothetical protein